MAKRSLYLPDDLERRVVEAARADNRSFSNFMQWAAEQVLGSAQGGEQTVNSLQSHPDQARAGSGSPASTRAPKFPGFNRASSLGPSSPVPRRGK